MSRRKCKFNDKLIKEYPMFIKTEHEAFCKMCCVIVSLANKGKADLIQHLSSSKHSKNCDCSTQLYRLMICNSEVASKIFSARTKTETIINNVLAPHSLKEVLKVINDNNISYIGVCADGSNHGAMKIFPILIQYFDKHFGIKHNLIELKSLTNETSETICNLLIETLESMSLLSK